MAPVSVLARYRRLGPATALGVTATWAGCFRLADPKVYAHVPVSWSTAAVGGCALVVIIVIATAATARGQTAAMKIKINASVLMSRLAAQLPPPAD